MTRRKLPISAALWTLLAVGCIAAVGGLAVLSVRENNDALAAVERSTSTAALQPAATTGVPDTSTSVETTQSSTSQPSAASPPTTRTPSTDAQSAVSVETGTPALTEDDRELRATGSTFVEPLPAEEPAYASPADLGRANASAVFKVISSGCDIESTGTAWAIDERHLVTNGHVVNIDMAPILQTRSGIRIPAEVVAWERTPDIAVLRVDVDLEPVDGWAPTGEVLEGSEITAVGFQLPDLAFTVIAGRILSFGVTDGLRVSINADAPVERGMSGAPVFASDGRIVGIVTAAVTDRFSDVPRASITPASVLSDLVDDMIGLEPGVVAEADCAAFAGDAIGELNIGDCVATESSGDLTIVSCDLPHEAEAYSTVDHPAPAGVAWPGTGKVRTFGISECESRFEAFVGLAYAFSTLEISPLVPSETSWEQGDRTIVCTVRRLDGLPLLTSVEGSAI